MLKNLYSMAQSYRNEMRILERVYRQYEIEFQARRTTTSVSSTSLGEWESSGE